MGSRIAAFLASKARWMWAMGAVCAMVVAFVSGAVIWTSLWTEDARMRIEDGRGRSLEAIISAKAVESTVLDRQRVLRGELIVGSHVEGSVDLAEARRNVARLEMLVHDDPIQMKRVEDLKTMLAEQEGRVSKTIEGLRVGRTEESIEAVRQGRGDRAVEAVRQAVGAIVGEERAHLQELRIEAGNLSRESENYTYAIGLICLLVVVLGGTAVMVSLSANWSLRLREMEALNEERMRIAHEATGAGTWEHIAGSGIVWSPETYLLYERDPRLGSPGRDEWLQMVHPDDAAECPWTAPREPSTSFASTFRIATRQGGWRWIVSRGFFFNRDGVDRLVGMDVDVTEQVANREELARLNDLLSREAASDRRDRELVFDAASDLMAIKSDGGVLVSVNPAWNRVLGWTADDLVGRRIGEFVAEGSQWPEADTSFSAEMRSASGATRIIEWSRAWDAKGRAIIAGRDVTEQREAEARLRDSETLVRQMQKMESVGQMTGGVAHDFNNMLTPIFGYLEMISKRHAEDPKTLRMVGVAMQSAEKAKALVSKLLSFARRQQLEYRVVDAGELVSGMAELVGKSVTVPGVEMSVEVADGPSCVRVDPNQFEMVLMNLAVNARDALSGGGRIRVSVRKASGMEAPRNSGVQEGAYVVVSVSDDGTGMDAETLARAVEPFYSTKGVGKGTGLGLSMAHGMAGQSGGALVLESALGVGTTASLWLPEMDPGLVVSLGEGSVVRAGEGLPSRRILLVDDDDVVRHSIEQMLTEMGHRVVVASSGSEAMSIIATDDAFDVLLTDYMMPNMTGGQLIDRVREIHPELPAVIVSGYTNAPEGKERAGVASLAKPFSSARLEEVLRRVVPAPSGGAGNVVELRRRPG